MCDEYKSYYDFTEEELKNMPAIPQVYHDYHLLSNFYWDGKEWKYLPMD